MWIYSHLTFHIMHKVIIRVIIYMKGQCVHFKSYVYVENTSRFLRGSLYTLYKSYGKKILNTPNGSYTGQTLQAIRKSLPKLWFKRTSILPIICRTLNALRFKWRAKLYTLKKGSLYTLPFFYENQNIISVY